MTEPHKNANSAAHRAPDKAPTLVRSLERRIFKIIVWSLVLGLGFAFLFSISASGSPDWIAIFKRGLIIGGVLAAAVVVVVVFLFPGLRRK